MKASSLSVLSTILYIHIYKEYYPCFWKNTIACVNKNSNTYLYEKHNIAHVLEKLTLPIWLVKEDSQTSVWVDQFIDKCEKHCIVFEGRRDIVWGWQAWLDMIWQHSPWWAIKNVQVWLVDQMATWLCSLLFHTVAMTSYLVYFTEHVPITIRYRSLSQRRRKYQELTLTIVLQWDGWSLQSAI